GGLRGRNISPSRRERIHPSLPSGRGVGRRGAYKTEPPLKLNLSPHNTLPRTTPDSRKRKKQTQPPTPKRRAANLPPLRRLPAPPPTHP
uniref:Uncharacterized protein n=1 Tax=Aegilops tauschii subsp. strangulata TaxID=200361 RepID=A0A453APB4_AEGTS